MRKLSDLTDLASASGCIAGVIDCLKDDVKDRENEMPVSLFKRLDKTYIETLERALRDIQRFVDKEMETYERITGTAHPRTFADELVADLCDAK